jgi:hypothetical protein
LTAALNISTAALISARAATSALKTVAVPPAALTRSNYSRIASQVRS